MIAYVEFEWLIAQQETESMLCVDVDRSLQVQFVERDNVLCRFHPFVFDNREMKLVVDYPVVVHKENCAVLQEELWDIWPLCAEDVEWGLRGVRGNRIRRVPVIEGHTVVNEGRSPEGVAGCPPAEIGGPHRNGHDWKNIKAENGW